MPLHPGTSRKVFSQNVSEMMHAGHPQDQALAAAYRMKRQHRDDGGVILSDPTHPEQTLGETWWSNYPVSTNIEDRRGGYEPIPNMMGELASKAKDVVHQNLPRLFPVKSEKFDKDIDNFDVTKPGDPGYPRKWVPPKPSTLAAGGLAAAYRMKREGRADGGFAPWFVRNEARSLTHTGPVPSIVPGRTDRHNVSVPAGSYVLPADHVSSLGQGNTQAGYAILNRMFSGGPYGSKALGIKHGSGPPHARMYATHMQKPFGSDEGGGRGEEHGSPTPVVIAGGEYVIPPHVVEAIGQPIYEQAIREGEKTKGPMDEGHQALDAWVEAHREKHIKTLRKLPPPAKR